MKPSDIYVGVIDLFAVFLPGALVVWFVPDRFVERIVPPAVADMGVRWVAFILASYGAGHFLFMISAQLDRLYGRVRARVWPDRPGNAYLRARALRDAELGEDAESAMNTFSWAKSRLLIEQPAAYASVQRFEADSKFFRSLTVVLLGLAALSFVDGEEWEPWGLVGGLLSLMAFARYSERRYKSTVWAYRYVIAMQVARERKD